MARIIDLKEWLRMPLTDNIWNSMITWPLNLLSVIITVRYHFFKSLFLPYFVWYLWRPNFIPCTWSTKVWHIRVAHQCKFILNQPLLFTWVSTHIIMNFDINQSSMEASHTSRRLSEGWFFFSLITVNKVYPGSNR